MPRGTALPSGLFPRHGAGAPERSPEHLEEADDRGHSHDRHYGHAHPVDGVFGHELEEGEPRPVGRAVGVVHEAREEQHQRADEARREEPGRREHVGKVSPVVARHGVAPRGGHERGRIGLGWAFLGALGAAVAAPEFRAGEQLLALAQLRVPRHPARERGPVHGKRARRRADAAVEAGGDVRRSEALELGVEVGIDSRGHGRCSRSTAWYRK